MGIVIRSLQKTFAAQMRGKMGQGVSGFVQNCFRMRVAS